MNFNNVIIHYYPATPYIAKCNVHLRQGKKIVFRIVLKDPAAAGNWLMRNNYYKPVKTIVHW